MARNKVFTAINIFGLAIAMSVSLVLILMVADQLSYDRHVTNSDRIYRVVYDNLNEDGMFSEMATSTPMMAPTLTERFSGVESYARLRGGFGNDWIGVDNDSNIPLGGFFADPQVLEFFDYELKYGNPETALQDPNSVVITQVAVDKLFTVDNPLGEIIKVGELGEYKITGVLKETNNKSHIRFEALASMSSVKNLVADSLIRSDVDDWKERWSFWTYIQLEEGVNKTDVLANIETINQEQFGEDDETNLKYSLQGLTEINPGPMMGNQIGPGMPVFFIYFLAGLCFLIMLSAGFNYTNLSIAKSLNRAREVGIRKVSGAFRRQIILQFISEAILVSLFALGIAFVLLVLLEPAFRGLKFTQMLHWDLSFNLPVIMFCVLFASLVGFLAGLFPALFLSSLKPLKVLKNLAGVRLFSKVGLRKTLIVSQFVLSLFLIITVQLAQNQLSMMMSADYGFNAENIISIKLGNTDSTPLKTELESQSSFSSVSVASHTPSMGRSNTNEMKINEEDEPLDLNYFSVDHDYLENMEIKLVAGSNFPEGLSGENENFLIVNQKVVESMGFESSIAAIDQQILVEEKTLTIIGVIENYNHEPMVTEISPMALRYLPDNFRQVQVKYMGARSDAVARIEQSWKKVNPGLKIDIVDMNEEISMFYEKIFSDMVKITSVISILAISIASLGLLGMAIFTAETKVKEITIRKVLGAETKSLIYLLSRSYFVMLLLSIFIAVPLTYLFNDFWLQQLAYRVNVGIETILTGVGIMLTLGLMTILSQTFKAARSNTVDALRGD